MDVIALDGGRLQEAVDVLCDAFADYPVMRFVLGPSGSAYDERLRRLVGFFTSARFLNGDLVLGVVTPGALAAVANVTRPGDRSATPELSSLREALWRELGDDARGRYERLVSVWRTFAVDGPHYHLNMLGVRRTMQKRGAARLLLNALQDISAETPACSGIRLETEDPANVPIYEHVGYRITGHAQVAPGLETWGFFRPNSAA